MRPRVPFLVRSLGPLNAPFFCRAPPGPISKKKEEGVFILFLLFASIVHFIFSAQEIQTNNIPQSDSDGCECYHHPDQKSDVRQKCIVA